jgi:hypothetical protein
MSRACNTHGREEEFILGFDGNLKGKKPVQRHRRRWENNIKIELRLI